ncbi:MAG: ankyrin repeat domain-containing protein, partial [Succinivibrionaceae bacterium]|nr:ankyrin repeat domain-containing protein [Succinivibrionaceae bacterium]
ESAAGGGSAPGDWGAPPAQDAQAPAPAAGNDWGEPAAGGKSADPGSARDKAGAPDASATGTADPAPSKDGAKASATPSAAALDPSKPEELVHYSGSTTEEQDKKFRQKVLTAFTKVEEIASDLKQGANPNAMGKTSLGGKVEAVVPVLFNYVDWKQARLEVVKLLVEHGALYNWESEDGKLNLAWPFLCAKQEILEYYLSLSPNLGKLRQLNPWKGTQRRSLLQRWIQSKDSYQNHLAIFNRLLDLGLDPNEMLETEGMYMLSYAYQKAGTDYALALLDHGADPSLCRIFNDSPLTLALNHDDPALLRKILEKGGKPSWKESESNALHYYLNVSKAAASKREPVLEVVKALAEGGADINWADDSYSVATDVVKSSPEIIDYYLGLKPTLKELEGKAGLVVELIRNKKVTDDAQRLGLVKRLLALGANPNHSDGSYPLLMNVYGKASKDILKALLDAGADPNAKDRWQEPLLFMTIEGADLETARLIKEHQGDINAKNRRGDTIMTTLADKEEINLDYAKGLMELGADVNATDKNGRTPLMNAVRQDHPVEGFVAELIKAGANANAADKNQRTALMHAVSGPDAPSAAIVSALLAAGADPNAVDKNQRTALMFAISEPDEPAEAIVEAITKAGAKVDAEDKDGATALVYAIGARSIPIVEALLKAGADMDKALSLKGEIKIDGEKKTMSLQEIIEYTYEKMVKEGKLDKNPKFKEFYDYMKKYL